MKKLSLLFVALLCLLLTGCTSDEVQLIPEIKTKVSAIGDEDYNTLSVINELKEAKRENFRTIEFTFLLEHADTVENRQIKMHVDWNKAEERLNDGRGFWYGISSEQNIDSENPLEHKQEVIFYAKGLSEVTINEAISEAKLTVEWIDNNNERISEQYNVVDLIEGNSK